MCGGRHRWHMNDEFHQVGEEYEQRVISSAHFIHVSNAVLPRKHTVLHTTAGHDVESFFIFPFSTRIASRLFCEKNGNKRLDSIWNGSTDCIQILFICVAKSHGTDRLCKYKNEYGKRTYSLSLSIVIRCAYPKCHPKQFAVVLCALLLLACGTHCRVVECFRARLLITILPDQV